MPRNSSPRRFAERTSVPIGKSKSDIEDLLRRRGAAQTATASDSESEMLMLAFTLDGRQFRIRASTKGKGSPEQRERQAWRALLLLLKGKLEMVAMGMSSLEAEFLANIVLPNGQTVGDDVLPKIAKCYESGKMPNLLPMGSSS